MLVTCPWRTLADKVSDKPCWGKAGQRRSGWLMVKILSANVDRILERISVRGVSGCVYFSVSGLGKTQRSQPPIGSKRPDTGDVLCRLERGRGSKQGSSF